ncbi:MAG TPA: hypothetical protein VHA56_19425 [Mucilaginibacter sp.]|nr:hypothetical protein [Mucilaginibacter sp.]
MHLAYSAISNTDNTAPETSTELLLRYQAFLAVCEKYRHEIAAIQKYIPGWSPAFR